MEFPKYIEEKWKRGVITHTHMTDLLRLELLIRYGGTWIDATVFAVAVTFLLIFLIRICFFINYLNLDVMEMVSIFRVGS